jgi:hypothetical protein
MSLIWMAILMPSGCMRSILRMADSSYGRIRRGTALQEVGTGAVVVSAC